jgi:hypothetical protein
MEKIDKSEDTIQITISKEVHNHLYRIADMLRASGCSNGGHRLYNQTIKYALIQAGLWDERERMNTAHDIFFCYDLGIPLTVNDCCHEDSCQYASKCFLMKPLSFDIPLKKVDTAKKNTTKKKLAVA